MEQLTLAKVLQDLPPGTYINVSKVLKKAYKGYSNDDSLIAIDVPDLYLHCDNDTCKGVRNFTHSAPPYFDDNIPVQESYPFERSLSIEYSCRNCQQSLKTFFLIVDPIDENEGTADVVKVGEYPFYGPTLPSKLVSILGPDRELFLKGRKCESMDLGIASFTYYRRVVENQKNRIIDAIISVLEKTNAEFETIAKLTEAKREVQFTKAINTIKNLLPKQLYINDHNPLTLLHKALSIGIHNLDDKECLDYAHSIRLVLSEFAERVSEVMKDHNDLKSAINKLNGLK